MFDPENRIATAITFNFTLYFTIMQRQEIASGIFIIEDFMLPEECSYYVHEGEELSFKEATVDTGSGHRMIKGIRNNDRGAIQERAART